VSLRRSLRVLGATAMLAIAAAAHAQAVTEPAVKAAFLYKFLGYVEWPPQALAADAPYVIGVAGADDVAAELERIGASRTINGRRLVVRRLGEGETPRGLQVLFVGRSQSEVREMLRSVSRRGVLTVTDADRGLELGSVINLVTADNHVAFEISLEAAERAGLDISSRMLSVARRVVPKGAS
jgi:hypothetical protein